MVRVYVDRVDPDTPAAAAAAATRTAFAAAARARPAILALVGWGPGPGLVAAPWTVDGIAGALQTAGLGVRYAALGDTTIPWAIRRRLGARGLHAIDEEDRRAIRLEVPGLPRPLRVPRVWIGRHLCLVAPMVQHRAGKGRVRGPTTRAFEALLAACEAGKVRDPLTVGARLIAEVFASHAVIIDATWWASRNDGEIATPQLHSLSRLAGVFEAEPTALASSGAALDGFLDQRVGLTAPRRSGIDEWGPAAGSAWSRVRAPTPSRRGLAGRALAALWRPNDGSHPTNRALTVPVPGPLGRAWEAYPEAGRGA